MLRRGNKPEAAPEPVSKVLEVDASMQGALTFRDPVNLRINGHFEGVLDTLGSLIIGEKAAVKATIHGDIISIAGEVVGDVIAGKELEILSTGRLIGDVETPRLAVQRGAVLQGRITMIGQEAPAAVNRHKGVMNADELASYLAVEKSLVFEWADSGKLPGVREGASWKFDKNKVDEWVANGRIK